MASANPTGAGVPSVNRLNGWKEIASYLGKGVRTVQRWEKDLGLPVRRIGTGRGEIVFALPDELDAWRAAAERRDDLASQPGEDDLQTPSEDHQPGPFHPTPAASTGARAAETPRSALSARTGTRRQPYIRLSAALLVLVVGCLTAWWLATRRPPQPYEARIENHALRVYDGGGRFLWEHRFEFPLADDAAARAGRAEYPSTVVDDIDGDGSREVLFITNVEPLSVTGGLFCFDGRGKLLFEHRVRRQVSYGGIACPGPWRPDALAVASDADGTKSVWLASQDRDQFPSVVEKLDGRGRVLGDFAVDGTVFVLVPTTFRGRAVMLLGGSNNEFNGAGVAIVDQGNPTGTAPALQPKFTCRGCPAGRPIESLVFPGSEIERLQDNNAGVAWIRRGDQGEFTIVVKHSLSFDLLGRGSGSMIGQTVFVLSADLHPLSAQHQPSFRVLHDEAYRRGALDHSFGPADDAALWPMLRWNGRGFDRVGPSASSR